MVLEHAMCKILSGLYAAGINELGPYTWTITLLSHLQDVFNQILPVCVALQELLQTCSFLAAATPNSRLSSFTLVKSLTPRQVRGHRRSMPPAVMCFTIPRRVYRANTGSPSTKHFAQQAADLFGLRCAVAFTMHARTA